MGSAEHWLGHAYVECEWLLKVDHHRWLFAPRYCIVLDVKSEVCNTFAASKFITPTQTHLRAYSFKSSNLLNNKFVTFGRCTLR